MRTIDTDALSNDATSLSGYIDTLHSEINKLNTTVTDNQEGYQGTRGTSFFNVLTENFVTDLNSLATDLESYQEFLSKVPKAYEMLDDEFGEKEIDV